MDNLSQSDIDDEFKEIDAENLGEESLADAVEEIVTKEETATETQSTVTVQPVQFASFEDLDQVQGPQNQNLNILLDVKLQLTVELGRTELPIKKVLELNNLEKFTRFIEED